jgi:hypothetical protein
MEIHHHPKHSNKPRRYTEYLFEFLVIFIAILGSFFAENIREHRIERHREKEYMMSMLLDLKAESQRLNYTVDKGTAQIKGLDSLLDIMNNKLIGNYKNKFHYYNFKYASDYNAFISVDRTLNQLMNTGGLSIINDNAVSDGIVVYSNSIKAALNQSELLETRYQKIIEYQTDIIDLQDIMRLKQGTSVLEMKEFPDLLTNDKKKLNAYYFTLVTFRGTIVGYLQRLKGLIEQNNLLTQLIQKDYDLEDNSL